MPINKRTSWKEIAEQQDEKIISLNEEAWKQAQRITELKDQISALQAEKAVLDKLAMRDAAAHHVTIEAGRLGNIAYSALATLMEDELGNMQPDITSVVEGQALLEFKKAIALRVDYVIIRLTHDASD